jgi:hypothetical protein
VTPADERALRRRLHEELDLADLAPAPVDAVFRRSRAVKTRRLAAIASGTAAIAVAAGVLAVSPPGHARPGPSGPRVTPALGGVFATGTANGKRWKLAAVNLADPGSRCLPGVVVNGRDGDLLQPGFLPGMALGNAAFWAASPGRPGIGFGFLWPRPGVSDVTVTFGDGTTRSVKAVAVAVCGQRFRLAGFEYPRQGVTRIIARSARGRQIAYTPLADYFNPASPLQTGGWLNVQGVSRNVAVGTIGSGSIGGTSWRMNVTLGPDGECFDAEVGPSSAKAGPSTAAGSASICSPIGAPPDAADITGLPYGRTMAWYSGTVNARTAYLRIHLSNGMTKRLVPASTGGRKYFALGVKQDVRLTRLTLYDARNNALADLTSLPRVK